MKSSGKSALPRMVRPLLKSPPMKTIAAIIGSALLAAACSDKPPENPSTVTSSTAMTTTPTESTAAANPAPLPATNDPSPGTSPSYAESNTSMSTDSIAPDSAADSTSSSTTNATAPRNGKATPYPTTGVAPGPSPDATGAKADDTKQNARDRHDTLTPGDQGNSKDEVKITASIRKQLVASKMSFNAKNAKVITTGTKVTLRGVVKTEEEKAQIESFAKGTAGVTEVDNQLDVKK